MRRSREEITASILNACSSRSRTVTQVMLSQNLSHNELKSRLEVLVPSRLVKVEQIGRKRIIRTTQLGITVLSCYRNAVALLSGRLAPCPLLSGRVSEFEIEARCQTPGRDRILPQKIFTE
jgi:predicted transcriptional regulator